MSKAKVYALTALYVGAILAVWQIGSVCLGEFSGLAFGVGAFMLSGGYMANRGADDKSFGYLIMAVGALAVAIGLVAPVFS